MFNLGELSSFISSYIYRMDFIFLIVCFFFGSNLILAYVFFRIGFKHLRLLMLYSCFGSSATTKENSVPTPHLEVHVTSPPNWLIIFFEICSPRPTPLVLSSFVASRNPNSLNNLSWSCFLIPIPVSSTWIWIIPNRACSYFSRWIGSIVSCLSSEMYFYLLSVKSAADWTNLHLIKTFWPLYVNFRAFDSRFRMTYWILC